MPLGQHERALFEEQATPLYEEIVTSGGISATDTRIASRGELHEAFELLRRARARQQERRRRPLACRRPGRGPGAGGGPARPAGRRADRGVGPLGAGLQHPLARVAPLAERRRRAVRRDPRRRPPSATSSPRWSATPRASCSPRSRRTAGRQAARPEVGAREIAALKRGVKMRTLYQHAARRGADTRKYVAAVTAAGAEVRTLDEFFNRLIVVDRRIAIIPSHEGARRRDGDQRAARWWATSSTCSSGTGSGPGRSPAARPR